MGEVDWHGIFLRFQRGHCPAAYWFYLFLGSSTNVQGAEENEKHISRSTWLKDTYSKKSTFQWLDIQIQIKRLDIPWPLSHCLANWGPSMSAVKYWYIRPLRKAQGLERDSDWIPSNLFLVHNLYGRNKEFEGSQREDKVLLREPGTLMFSSKPAPRTSKTDTLGQWTYQACSFRRLSHSQKTPERHAAEASSCYLPLDMDIQ